MMLTSLSSSCAVEVATTLVGVRNGEQVDLRHARGLEFVRDRAQVALVAVLDVYLIAKKNGGRLRPLVPTVRQWTPSAVVPRLLVIPCKRRRLHVAQRPGSVGRVHGHSLKERPKLLLQQHRLRHVRPFTCTISSVTSLHIHIPGCTRACVRACHGSRGGRRLRRALFREGAPPRIAIA